MPNVSNDNILAALYLYKKRIGVLKKQTEDTMSQAAVEEITQLQEDLQLNLINIEIDEIVEYLALLNHLLGEK